MAVVINEVTIEPKAAPPGGSDQATAAKSAGADAGGAMPPEAQREIEKMMRQSMERTARLFAH